MGYKSYNNYNLSYDKTGVKYYDNLRKWLARARAEKQEQTAKAAARKKEAAKKKRKEAAKKRKREEMQARKKMETMNKQIEKWNEKGLTGNAIRLFQHNIELFNWDVGIDSDLFVPNMPMNKNILDEAKELLKYYEENQSELNVDYYIDLFDKMQSDAPTNDNRLKNLRELKDRFDIDTVQKTIDFIDNMEAYKTNALIHDILSSEQYELLQDRGMSLGMESNTVDDIIVKQYNETGFIFNNLYNIVFDALKKEASKYNK